MIDQKTLREQISYNPETGVMTWIVSRRGVAAGTEAGSVLTLSGGRLNRSVMINGKRYLAHRLAFLYMVGRWPSHEIDHRDLDTLNNRWSNLREATRSQNAANQSIQIRNTTGFKGVRFHKAAGRYVATIKVNKVAQHLGCFDTPEEAHAAYVAAAKNHFGEFARAA